MRAETLSSQQVSAFTIGVMADVLDGADIDADAALEKIGVGLGAAFGYSGTVPAQVEVRFERLFFALTADRPDLWAEVGRRHKLYTYGAFGLALGTSPTLRDWVRLAARTRDLCITFTDYRPVERSGRLVGIECCFDTVPEDLLQMTFYRDLGAMSTVIAEVWPGSTRGFRLQVAAPSSQAGFLADIFPFRVDFDQDRTVLSWPAAVTDIRLSHGSRRLHDYYVGRCTNVSRRVPGSDLEAAITRVILMQPAAHGTVQAVARRLNLSTRTLQRRLNQDGLTFRAILHGAHSELARDYLANSSLSIAEIAARIGYADRTSFDLAFARWTGLSPRRFRDLAPKTAAIGMP